MASAKTFFNTCCAVKTQVSPSANREMRQEIVSQLFGSRTPTFRVINVPNDKPHHISWGNNADLMFTL